MVTGYDPILKAFRDGDSSIDLNGYYKPQEGKPPIMLSRIILGSPLRQFFISKVKLPLMNALIMVAKLIPEITKQNTSFKNTHTLIDIFDRFWKHEDHSGREALFKSVFKLLTLEMERDLLFQAKFRSLLEEVITLYELEPSKEELVAECKVALMEVEHDIFYRDRFNWFLEEIIKAILRGDWQERTNGNPMQGWHEAEPYGGNYSIIRILQNKKAMENLLGDNWRLKEEKHE